MASADRLTGQLTQLPDIVGRLGLSIARSQKEMNVDYLESIKFLLDQIKRIGPDLKDDAAILALLKALAPSRYQFTETTLDFSADLSESLDVAGGVGIGAAFINIAVSAGFGYDYRAAARVRTVIHALPPGEALATTLLARAEDIAKNPVKLPDVVTKREADITNNLSDIVKSLTGKVDDKPLAPTKPATPATPAPPAPQK